MSELKDCIKCGGTAGFEQILDDVRVYCTHCQERTPWYTTDSEAIEAWNTGERFKVKGCRWTPRCLQTSCAECLGFVDGGDEGCHEHRETWDALRVMRDEPSASLLDGAVRNPAHYCEGRKYEPWDVIKDWGLDYDLGCVVKYVSRAGRKDSRLTDLRKAREYLDHAIKTMEEER